MAVPGTFTCCDNNRPVKREHASEGLGIHSVESGAHDVLLVGLYSSLKVNCREIDAAYRF
jgi:hypothetical protein